MSNVTLWSRPTWTVDQMLRDVFGPAVQANEATGSAFNPAAEVLKDGEDALVRLEIPGVDIDRDVKVELDGGRLVVSGERRDEHAENRDGRSLREVRYGAFQRSFAVPAHIKGWPAPTRARPPSASRSPGSQAHRAGATQRGRARPVHPGVR